MRPSRLCAGIGGIKHGVKLPKATFGRLKTPGRVTHFAASAVAARGDRVLVRAIDDLIGRNCNIILTTYNNYVTKALLSGGNQHRICASGVVWRLK